MKLETDRLLLRPWDIDDAEALYKYASDPAVGPAAGWAVHTCVADSRAVIRQTLSGENIFALVLRETGEPVGSMGLHFRDGLPEGQPELGYWVARPYWGRGLALEAARRVLQYAFDWLECPRVWCAHYRGNDRSRRVIEKLGFRPEYIRESYVPAFGERRVTYYYSLYRAEGRGG